jgi:hypothetical protein
MSKSIVDTHTSENKHKRKFIRQTLDALLPFINKEQCGEWVDYNAGHHPVFMISQEQWRLLEAWKGGNRRVCYELDIGEDTEREGMRFPGNRMGLL